MACQVLSLYVAWMADSSGTDLEEESRMLTEPQPFSGSCWNSQSSWVSHIGLPPRNGFHSKHVKGDGPSLAQVVVSMVGDALNHFSVASGMMQFRR